MIFTPKVSKVNPSLSFFPTPPVHLLGRIPSYNLIGVSNHSGTVYSGHYTAQCKHPYTNQWHEFNDSSVYSLNDPTRMISSNAYVLFYEQN